MPTAELGPWSGNDPITLPTNATEPKEIVRAATQLSVKDRQHVVAAFNSGLYEMVATFVWNKALTSLKAQLGKLGANFLSEMLDRPDIDNNSPIEQKLTDYEALRLAEELGIIRGTGAFRLRQSFERLNHFGSMKSEEGDDDSMSSDEAIGVLRACVANILGLERIEAALDFKHFRDSLSLQALTSADESIEKLTGSPYFFKRASIRMLLALAKTATGAQLEIALSNVNFIIPLLWSSLLLPDRHQVGRVYAEVMNEGKSIAASGMKKLLLKVHGFDFVPEDLRSRSFISAAHKVIEAHEGMNNFYNEPGPTRSLERMGNVIPIPAFPICMSALISVIIGNSYGISYGAQEPASNALKRVPSDRWIYYLSECLPGDERVLYKLLSDGPMTRWSALVEELKLAELEGDLSKRDIQKIALGASGHNHARFRAAVARCIANLGYATK